MSEKEQQMSDSFRIAALLAFVGGFMDVYTYLTRGKVFANAQTGNIVLFGMHLASGEWVAAFSYFIPILAFVLGIFMDEWIKKVVLPMPIIHWRQIVLLFESLVLLFVTFLPLGGKADLVANTLISFVCSMQAQSFRKVHGLPYASTMCTGNLRSGTELLFRYTQTKERTLYRKSLDYYGVNFCFILGAGIGALLTQKLGGTSTVYCSVLLLFACMMLTMRKNTES